MLWEYNRIGALTRLKGSKFYYNVDVGDVELQKGASCGQFTLQALYGEDEGSKLNFADELKDVKRRCTSQYLRVLNHILRSFRHKGTIPECYSLTDTQLADDNTRKDMVVRCIYLTQVLLQWFSRVKAIIAVHMSGGDGKYTPPGIPIVSDRFLPITTWEWVSKTVVDVTEYGPDAM